MCSGGIMKKGFASMELVELTVSLVAIIGTSYSIGICPMSHVHVREIGEAILIASKSH